MPCVKKQGGREKFTAWGLETVTVPFWQAFGEAFSKDFVESGAEKSVFSICPFVKMESYFSADGNDIIFDDFFNRPG